MAISVSSERFSKLQQKYKVTQFCLSSQFNGFVYAVFSMFEFGQNLVKSLLVVQGMKEKFSDNAGNIYLEIVYLVQVLWI